MKRSGSHDIQTTLNQIASALIVVSSIFFTGTAAAVEALATTNSSLHANDTHYTDAGFFDIHVCNWPNRELFFMALFSTIRYREVADIKVHYPDGRELTSLDLTKFKIIKTKDKPEKHVFMSQLDVPDSAVDGWYSATISLADGTQIIAKDYVIISHLPRASDMNPADGAEQIALPEKLTWSGAEKGYYQVFIRDAWNDSKLIYKSKLLSKPELTVPAGLLELDSLYSWQIHTRDVNEDILLGDFNKGSMSSIVTFSTSEN